MWVWLKCCLSKVRGYGEECGGGWWWFLSSNAWWALQWKRIWIPSLQLWGLEQKFKLMVHRPNQAVDVLFSSQNVGLQNVFKGFEMVANLKVRRCHIKIPSSGFHKKIRISGTHLSKETINESWKVTCSSVYYSPYYALLCSLSCGHIPDAT